MVDELYGVISPTYTLLEINISDEKASVSFVKTEFLDNDRLDYSEATYFQEEGKRGYYSSYGFGTNFREYDDGSLEDFFAEEPRGDAPEFRVEYDIFHTLKAYGIEMDEIRFREFFPDGWAAE